MRLSLEQATGARSLDHVFDGRVFHGQVHHRLLGEQRAVTCGVSAFGTRRVTRPPSLLITSP